MKSALELIKKSILFPQYLLIRNRIRTDSCCVLVGTSTYNNLGDHLLSKNSIDFINHYFPNKSLVEIPTQVFKRFEKKLSKNLNPKTTVFISAGGWMGNLWIEDERCMQRMITAFSNNRIYILPQTVYYDCSFDNYQESLDIANQLYKKCRDITLFVREANSEIEAKDKLNINKVYLAPDMGLYGEISKANKKTSHIVYYCMRNDRESSSLFVDEEKELLSIFFEMNYSIHEFNTITRHNIPRLARERCLEKLQKDIKSNADIVVTDRLHGMIFAVICGCKCIAFDNKNHKVSGVYNAWLKNNKNVLLVDEKNPLDKSRVKNLLKSDFDSTRWANMIKEAFSSMAEIMKGR